ncbi:sulfite exporter TauE/SafE family protein [Candidatus Bipolaricaulota bacterium]|nr:sulfite exporter TauE/SafE family protein [Candidatus Bipolaricaulota bacterium]
MSTEVVVLLGTAATIGFVHTLIGPDHYLPFIVLSKARSWSTKKTVLITFLCGLGHVLSSIVLGFAGIAVGIAVSRLEIVESLRGEIASWVLIGFGVMYTAWGIRSAVRNRPHTHFHAHEKGEGHTHEHGHVGEHGHVHDTKARRLTPWALFIIFVLGPCEPLIPLLMYPAATGSVLDVMVVASVFGVVTIGTMLGVVLVLRSGLARLPLGPIERYAHALAGLAILTSGGAMKLFGL